MGAAKSLTLIATSQLLDRPCAGRRRLLLASFGGMAVALLALAVGAAGDIKMLVVVSVFVYVAWFRYCAVAVSSPALAWSSPPPPHARSLSSLCLRSRVVQYWGGSHERSVRG